MKQYILKILVFFFAVTRILFAQPYLISVNKLATIPKESLNFIPGVVPQYDVDMYHVLYNTVDVNGQLTQASGAMMIPLVDSCDFFPHVSFQHGTVLHKNDVPSRNNSEAIVGQYFASIGYIATMPDYLGLGDNQGLHPYVHALTEATATIDLIRACREFFTDSLNISHNGQLFLAGYSQGGHATMAAHKYIEDNNLTSEFNVVASAPGAGPYHLSGAQADMVFLNPAYPRQGYIIYLLFAYNYVYQNMFNHPSEVLKPPYDSIIPPYLNGNYNMGQLNNVLPDSLHEYLLDSIYQMILDHYTKSHPIWQNLALNDNYDWAPQSPVRLLYCKSDEQVSYLNSISAVQQMISNGATDVQAIDLNPSGTHGSCTGPALLYMINWFNSLMIPCFNNNTHNVFPLPVALKINPNPANDYVFIEGLNIYDRLEVYNSYGKLMMYIEVNSDEAIQVYIKNFSSGIYIINIIRNQTVIKIYKQVKF